jgi:hypothetical protein
MAIIPTWRHRSEDEDNHRPRQHRCALTKEQTLAVEFYREIETHRTNMQTAFQRLQRLLNTHPSLRPGWERFLGNGYATSAQLRECFLQQRAAPPSTALRSCRDLLRVVAENVS